jgi:hypothetical protein
MKKLFTLCVALFSASLTRGMQDKDQLAFARPPSIIAQTPLGKITQMQVDEAIIAYSLERDNEPTIMVKFDAEQKQFSGKTILETLASNGMHLCSTQYPIANQAEVESLFNQYEKAFNATSNKTDGCSIQ